jgi:hypothetical protein
MGHRLWNPVVKDDEVLLHQPCDRMLVAIGYGDADDDQLHRAPERRSLFPRRYSLVRDRTGTCQDQHDHRSGHISHVRQNANLGAAHTTIRPRPDF